MKKKSDAVKVWVSLRNVRANGEEKSGREGGEASFYKLSKQMTADGLLKLAKLAAPDRILPELR